MSKKARPTNAEKVSERQRKAEEQRMAEQRRSTRKKVAVASVAAVAVLAIVSVVLIVVNRFSLDDIGPGNATPPAALHDGIQSSQNKTDDAPHKVEVYLDFMCPVCAQFEKLIGTQLRDMSANGEITLVYKPVSILDGMSQNTRYSSRAASAAVCVAEHSPSRVDEFFDKMFENQPREQSTGLKSTRIAEIAGESGVSEEGQKCIKSNPYLNFITEKTDADGINSTPTVKVDGEVIDNNEATAEKLRARFNSQKPDGNQPAPSATSIETAGQPPAEQPAQTPANSPTSQ